MSNFPDKTPEHMEPQEIFHTAVQGVVNQKALGKDPFKPCCYRTHTGRACGVGQLLDDKDAKEFDRHGPIYNVPNSLLKPWMKKNTKLLTKIQQAHDIASSVKGFVENAKELVQPFSLVWDIDTSPLQESV